MEPATTTKPLFTITKIILPVFVQPINSSHEVCAICKVSLDDPSIEIQLDPSKSERLNLVMEGTCGHMFHKECWEHWLETKPSHLTRITCLLCGMPWHLKAIHPKSLI